MVVGGAGVGAFVGGELYGSYTVLGATLGLMIGESVSFARRRQNKTV